MGQSGPKCLCVPTYLWYKFNKYLHPITTEMLSLSTENQNGTMTMHVLSFNSLAHYQLFLDKHTYLVKNLEQKWVKQVLSISCHYFLTIISHLA